MTGATDLNSLIPVCHGVPVIQEYGMLIDDLSFGWLAPWKRKAPGPLPPGCTK